MGLLLRWCQFIKERFDPVLNTVTIAALFSANAAIACLSYPSDFSKNWCFILQGFLLVWLIFFHMRLFDDVKDYEIDKVINKDRPLPRGLLSLTEYGFGVLGCIIVEIILAFSLGRSIFLSYIVVLSFTLVMRLEFFIGDWLRPKMELYAITHTFSACLQGLLVCSIFSGASVFEMKAGIYFFALCNWFVFNVYEFGRKTFGHEEERDGVDSYSNRLKPVGAFLLLFANMIFAIILLAMALLNTSRSWSFISADGMCAMLAIIGIITLFVVYTGIRYYSKPDKIRAKLYRNSVSLYLVLFYLPIPIIISIYFI